MDGNSRGLIDVQGDPFLNITLETLGLDLKLIEADGQFQQEISTVTSGIGGTCEASFILLDANRGTLDHRAAGINHRPANASCNLLRIRAPASKQRDHQT